MLSSIASTVGIKGVELLTLILSITFIAALSDSEYNISISFIFNSFDQSYCGLVPISKKYKFVLSAIVGETLSVVSNVVEVGVPVTIYKSLFVVNTISLAAIVPDVLSIVCEVPVKPAASFTLALA